MPAFGRARAATIGLALMTLLPLACTPAAPQTAAPTSAATARSSPAAASPTPSATPTGPAPSSPAPSPTASPTSVPSPPSGSAPTSAAGFSFRKAVVPMGFPLPARSGYEYANNFFQDRPGPVRWYNHAKRVRADGSLQRAHDGVDLYVPIGTTVLSPFDGRVADPATLWRPWDPRRYGLTAVVISEEATSRGYAALLAHLERLDVVVGQRVRRGERVGAVGDSGNAEGIADHVHFELRAPFPLSIREAGRIRRLDAFDPYPSLVAADPRRD